MRGQNLALLIARIPPKVMLVAVTTLAIGAAVLVESEIQKKEQLLKNAQAKNDVKEMGQLLVAVKDIPEGTPISADQVRVDAVERSRIPVGALQDSGAAVGLQARASIHAGDCILSQSLQYQHAAAGFEAKIPSGYRAITFPVDATTGVAGFLQPDCHVDILAQTGSGVEAKATPILSDVQVVAVNQTYQKKAGVDEAQASTNCVTVAVQPKDGQKLINAMSSGKLYCLMRNQRDHSPLAVRDISTVFPKGKTDQSSASEISSIPPMPMPPSPVVHESALAKTTPLPPVLHSIDQWSASKRDELTVPAQ